jgi:hypothetical protein
MVGAPDDDALPAAGEVGAYVPVGGFDIIIFAVSTRAIFVRASVAALLWWRQQKGFSWTALHEPRRGTCPD